MSYHQRSATEASVPGVPVSPRGAPRGVEWGEYEPYEPGCDGLWQEWSRSVAQKEFKALMAARPQRKVILCDLLAVNGVVLTDDVAGVAAMDDWFYKRVELVDGLPDGLGSQWAGVAVDMGLFLGDMVVGCSPKWRWDLSVAMENSPCYQHPAVVWHDEVRNMLHVENLLWAVSFYGLKVAQGRRIRPGHLLRLFQDLVKD